MGTGNTLPDRITLYQRLIEEDYDDEDEIRAVGETLIHEAGHYFGMSEEIEEIEERYWRGEDARPGRGRRRRRDRP